MILNGAGAVFGSVGGGGSLGDIGAIGGGMGTCSGEPERESTSDREEHVDSLLTRRSGGGGGVFGSTAGGGGGGGVDGCATLLEAGFGRVGGGDDFATLGWATEGLATVTILFGLTSARDGDWDRELWP